MPQGGSKEAGPGRPALSLPLTYLSDIQTDNSPCRAVPCPAVPCHAVRTGMGIGLKHIRCVFTQQVSLAASGSVMRWPRDGTGDGELGRPPPPPGSCRSCRGIPTPTPTRPHQSRCSTTQASLGKDADALARSLSLRERLLIYLLLLLPRNCFLKSCSRDIPLSTMRLNLFLRCMGKKNPCKVKPIYRCSRGVWFRTWSHPTLGKRSPACGL